MSLSIKNLKSAKFSQKNIIIESEFKIRRRRKNLLKILMKLYPKLRKFKLFWTKSIANQIKTNTRSQSIQDRTSRSQKDFQLCQPPIKNQDKNYLSKSSGFLNKKVINIGNFLKPYCFYVYSIAKFSIYNILRGNLTLKIFRSFCP